MRDYFRHIIIYIYICEYQSVSELLDHQISHQEGENLAAIRALNEELWCTRESHKIESRVDAEAEGSLLL
jgi:hypothetical protein